MSKCVAEGGLVFEESPLQCLQSLDNRQEVLCCGGCLRFVGTTSMQLDLLTRSKTRADMVGAAKEADEPYGPRLSDVLSCRDGCGEVYCSTACAERHWENGHCLLCTGRILDEEAESHPLMVFKRHACVTNEIFLMVADIFAGIVAGIEKGKSVEDVCRPYEGYVRELWWDAVADPDPVLKAKLRDLVVESWLHLSAALNLHERGLALLLSEEYFARTVGMFEQNNVGIQLSNPVGVWARNASASESADSLRLLGAAKTILTLQGCEEGCESEEEDEGESTEMERSEHEEEEEGEEGEEEAEGEYDVEKASCVAELVEAMGGDDALWMPLSGAAFYSTICKINHSCEPNVVVVYALSNTRGLVARVEALRPLVPGEELLHSYVDREESYAMRTAALAEYGFTCGCRRCLAKE